MRLLPGAVRLVGGWFGLLVVIGATFLLLGVIGFSLKVISGPIDARDWPVTTGTITRVDALPRGNTTWIFLDIDLVLEGATEAIADRLIINAPLSTAEASGLIPQVGDTLSLHATIDHGEVAWRLSPEFNSLERRAVITLIASALGVVAIWTVVLVARAKRRRHLS